MLTKDLLTFLQHISLSYTSLLHIPSHLAFGSYVYKEKEKSSSFRLVYFSQFMALMIPLSIILKAKDHHYHLI